MILQVDWNLVAQEAGYTNAKCASTRFGQMKKKFSAKNGTPVQSPSASFNSISTILNTPTGSPSKSSAAKRVKKEIGSGTNVNSGGVRKTPVKGNGMARGPNAKVGGRGMEDVDKNDGGEAFVHGNGTGFKYQDYQDGAFLGEEY